MSAATPAIASAPARRHGFLGAVLRTPSGMIGVALLAIVSLIAVFAPLIAPYDPNMQFSGFRLSPPGTAGHWLGTDELSRDILSRVIYGTRVSLLVGFFSVSAGAAIGIALGIIAGMTREWIDTLLMRACDILLAYPGILLGIIAVAILGPGLSQVCIAVAFVNIPIFARLTRGAVLRERELEYVKAAIVGGAGPAHIMMRHILPNSVGVVVTQISAAAGHAILLEASLSFIGLGIQPPTASWGSMLSKSREHLATAPLYAIVPGVLLLVLVLGLNFFSDAMQRALNPASTKR
ncbi:MULTISPECIES: ABC transporter permease [unclassified Chelatococcus]|uniref:ABC transporter permease n=1 Tax=unclassified Chelatococcus TaxID=2638111 RepID=UPI001BCC731C|nr:MULTISPECIES: ABC transporter permease [unclassified Chelatococcus]MBS7700358.1 ABC transporter permease [Chelatococcus sp. YT9]MBX3556154.1 ABC transporter permease [Chelatococcus sp.]